MERKCIALNKHVDEVMPEGIREFVSAHWIDAIREFWCAYCGKPLTGNYPMKISLRRNSVYTFLPICYCHNDGLDGHELFFRIIKRRDGRPERYQLGFCLKSSCDNIWADYLKNGSDEAVLDNLLPIHDFWESCYLLPDGNLLVPATDGNLFVTILRLNDTYRNTTKRYYNEKYEVKVRQNGFQRPIVVTGDDAGAEFNFEVRELNDKNVAMSQRDGLVVMGVASGWWIAFSKKELMPFAIEADKKNNYLLYVVPTFGVEPGNLIVKDEKYYFVTSLKDGGVWGTEVTGGRIGGEYRIDPENKVLGSGIYYKVIAVADATVDAKKLDRVAASNSMLDDAAMAKIFMLSSMMENSGKPGLKNLLVPLAFTTNKNADVAARTVMLYAMLNGMFGSE